MAGMQQRLAAASAASRISRRRTKACSNAIICWLFGWLANEIIEMEAEERGWASARRNGISMQPAGSSGSAMAYVANGASL